VRHCRGHGTARPRPTRTHPPAPETHPAAVGATATAGAATAGGTPHHPPATQAAAGVRIQGPTPEGAGAGKRAGAGSEGTSRKSRALSTW
jgi:hypothetical protein